MLVPPHMIEEQSKIIYQINKYYVERVQTRVSIIDKTIREICQIIQDILRVSRVSLARELFHTLIKNWVIFAGSGGTRTTIYFESIGMQWQVSSTKFPAIKLHSFIVGHTLDMKALMSSRRMNSRLSFISTKWVFLTLSTTEHCLDVQF